MLFLPIKLGRRSGRLTLRRGHIFIPANKHRTSVRRWSPVATENRIRDGADAAMGYPRFAMLDLLKLLSGLLVGLFRSHAAREAETAFLRQQLVVLKRSAPARLRLRPADRLIFVWLYRLCPSVRQAAVEWACRTADRLDPTRVPPPCRGVGGKAPPSSVGELRHLLQRGAHAPCARQGCSAPSTCADSRAYRISHLARRSPSALRSDGIIATHRMRRVGGTPCLTKQLRHLSLRRPTPAWQC
jgi:hypothetical protein